jgi:N-acetylmuramic acid 6-phosphate etherase
MVDLRATNTKLWERGARIVSTLTGLNRDESLEILKKADGWVKVAVVMQRRDLSNTDAMKLLNGYNGSLRRALEEQP